MSLIFKLTFVALFCAVIGRQRYQGISEPQTAFGKPVHLEVQKDVPLTIRLLNVGDRSAVFNITGNDTVGGLPIVDLFVNYSVDGLTTELKTQQISSSDAKGTWSKVIQVNGFNPGQQYEIQFAGENAKHQKGPISRDVTVLLLPPTPDITVLHPSQQKLKVIWGEKRSKSKDYYLLTVEKVGAFTFSQLFL